MLGDVPPAGQRPGRPPVRTITIGVADAHPLTESQIAAAAAVAHAAQAAFEQAGYEVQTVRLSTRSVFADMAQSSPSQILAYTAQLQRWLTSAGVRFCSLGPAPAADPAFPLDRLITVADILIGADALSCPVLMATTEHGIRYEAAPEVARLVRRLAHGTADGLGNFRFAMLACVGPGAPFFPAAYHAGPANVTVGLQGAGVVAAALAGTDFRVPAGDDEKTADLRAVTNRVRAALGAAGRPVAHVARRYARTAGLRFAGIDLSPAPAGADSIAAVIEQITGSPFGSPGTMAAAGALTEAIRGTDLPTCGFTGLMLPVLEDVVLARRWEEGNFNIQQLLAYSAVCGTGLDTIPLPGDIAPAQIARLLLDVATLAVRWNKPLSARLFPAPGRKYGDRTSFHSPYLVESLIRQ